MFDLMGPDAANGMTAAAAAAGNPDRLPVPGQAELDMFYGEHGLTGELFEQFRESAVPAPDRHLPRSVGRGSVRERFRAAHLPPLRGGRSGPHPGRRSRLDRPGSPDRALAHAYDAGRDRGRPRGLTASVGA